MASEVVVAEKRKPGRPKNTPDRRYIELQRQRAILQHAKVHPLQAMLKRMNWHLTRVQFHEARLDLLMEYEWGNAKAMREIEQDITRHYREAGESARDAAPYAHHRFESVDVNVTGNVDHEHRDRAGDVTERLIALVIAERNSRSAGRDAKVIEAVAE